MLESLINYGIFWTSDLINSRRSLGLTTSTFPPCRKISLFISEKSETGKVILRNPSFRSFTFWLLYHIWSLSRNLELLRKGVGIGVLLHSDLIVKQNKPFINIFYAHLVERYIRNWQEHERHSEVYGRRGRLSFYSVYEKKWAMWYNYKYRL